MANFVNRIQIKELELNVTNALIVAVLIAKSEVKLFESKNNSAVMCGVFTVTVRDSQKDYVNCIIWGSEHFIDLYDKNFNIGDVVDIVTPKVLFLTGERSEQYQPITSSPFYLKINEGHGEILIHQGDNCNKYHELLTFPIKSTKSITYLNDLGHCGMQSSIISIDILVAIRVVKPPRNITTKTGNISQCREIVVMDKTLSKMTLTLWNKNYIKRSNDWIPFSTVLLLIDVRNEYSTFYKSVTISLTNRSLIIENPLMPETEQLKKFALNISLNGSEKSSSILDNMPDPSNITTVMTVRQIYDKAENDSNNDSDQFTALLYGVVTHLDLDGYSRILSKKCSICKKSLKEGLFECDNDECVLQIYHKVLPKFIEVFNIEIGFSDHTGTLNNCFLVKEYAEKILNCKVEDFKQLDIEEKVELKWKYLLEKCAIKIIVKRKTSYRSNFSIAIVDCQVADFEDIVKNIKFY